MQVSIDNSKRKYAININEEIASIKKELGVDQNGYPEFWFILQRKNKFSKSIMAYSLEAEAQRKKNEAKTNHDLICPMNYLYSYQFPRSEFRTRTIPISQFFVKAPIEEGKRRSRKAEELIYKYIYLKENCDEVADAPLLEDEYEALIKDLQSTFIKESDYGIVASLVDRAFLISPQMRSYEGSDLAGNKKELLNILYRCSPKALLKCFSKRL